MNEPKTNGDAASPKTINAVVVYCSSSDAIAPAYLAAGDELGRRVAGNGWTLVYGGNRVGLMGRLADAARAAGGRVVGITPQYFIDRGQGDDRADELVVAGSMRHRKQLLEERGDAFVALPGGIGTFEEFFEILVGRALGYHDKPIVLVNLDGYYDPLLAMLDHGVEQGFVRPAARSLFDVATSVRAAVEYLRGQRADAHVRPEDVPSAQE